MKADKQNMDKPGTVTNGSVYDDDIIEKMKVSVEAEVSRNRKKLRVYATVLVVMAILYAGSRMQGETGYNIGLTFITAGFILGSVYFYFKSRPIKDSFYGLPFVEFLTKAEKKLEYIKKTEWLALIPLLLLLGTGGGLIFVSRLSQHIGRTGLLTIIWIAFFIILTLFGYFAGLKRWEKEQGSLHRQIKELKHQFNEDMTV